MHIDRIVAGSCVALAVLLGTSPVTRGQETLPGVARGGVYAPGTLGTVTQPAPMERAPDAIYGVGPWPSYTPPLADGPGRDLVHGVCSICHSTTYITMQPPLPPATWQAVVTKMIKTFGAPISDDTARAVVDYLNAHYTPETRRQ